MAAATRYEKLYQLLREELGSGAYKVGDRFPSRNELIKRFQLSFATVTRALRDLEEAGYLDRQRGRGTFVRNIPSGSDEWQKPTQVAVFLPWNASNPAHVNFQRLYSAMEKSRAPNQELKLIPYCSNLRELDAYLFSTDRCQGALFAYPPDALIPFITRFARSQPTVVLGRDMAFARLPSVWCDNEAASEIAVSHLIRLGHRCIGMVSGSLSMTDSQERVNGYKSALRAAGIPFVESLVTYTDNVELNGYGATLDLFDRNTDKDITAVYAAGDVIALGVMAAARAMGRGVPLDLSVMGFDDIEQASWLTPPLTTMHVPMEELAAGSLQLLQKLLSDGSVDSLQLPARLVVRGSVAPAHSLATSGSLAAAGIPPGK